MTAREQLSQFIEEREQQLIDLSDNIWNYAEIGYKEWKSAEALVAALKQEGFTVEEEVAGMETAFVGSYGSGEPVIAILGEYDALSGLSQKAGVAERAPIEEGGNGHGCGHNLFGVGSLAAAVALRHYMEEHKMEGTVRYYGCPAEENGCAKTIMVYEGLFDDVDFALAWHPGSLNQVRSQSSLACTDGTYRFKGRSAHAAASPHLGRSALDAVELMNAGVNYLREHVIPDARIHYAVTNTGGISPNVVQPEAEVVYYVRAPRWSQAEEIVKRIDDIARGAALMTGTEVEIPVIEGVSNLIPNTTLEKVMHKNFEALGTPTYTEEEKQFAQKIRETFSEEEKKDDIKHAKGLEGKELSDRVEPYEDKDGIMYGSTDVADVSWVVPTAQCSTACMALGTPGHSWQLVSQGKTSIGHKGMIHAGKVMAATALEVMQNPEVIEEAKQELMDRRDGEEYVSPLTAKRGKAKAYAK